MSVVGHLEMLLGLRDRTGKPAVLCGGLDTIPVLRMLSTDEDRAVSQAALLRLAQLLKEKNAEIRCSAAEVLRSSFGRGEERDQELLYSMLPVLEERDPIATVEILKLWTETVSTASRTARKLEVMVLLRMIH